MYIGAGTVGGTRSNHRFRIAQPILTEPRVHPLPMPSEESAMTTTDKAKNTTEQAKGKLKEVVGNVSGNDKLRAEGKTDQAMGNLKQAGEKVKDALKK